MPALDFLFLHSFCGKLRKAREGRPCLQTGLNVGIRQRLDAPQQAFLRLGAAPGVGRGALLRRLAQPSHCIPHLWPAVEKRK